MSQLIQTSINTPWLNKCEICGFHTELVDGLSEKLYNFDNNFYRIGETVCAHGHHADIHLPVPKEPVIDTKKDLCYVQLGAGLQSTFIAIALANKDERFRKWWDNYDLRVIFSDPMGEEHHTYKFLYNRLVPYLQERGMKIIIIQREHGLLHYMIGKGHVPMGVHNPLCSSWSKRDNIRAYYRYMHKKEGYKNLTSKYIHITELLGITTDEILRVNKETGLKWLSREYPLIDLGLSRSDLYKIYKEYKFEPPKKSGCWFCPNKGSRGLNQLSKDDVDRYAILMQMEFNSRRSIPVNPPTFIYKKTLRQIREEVFIDQMTLDDWFSGVVPVDASDNYEAEMCGASCMT